MWLTSRQPTMRGAVVWRQVGVTKHGNGNRKYELLSPAHAAAGGALAASGRTGLTVNIFVNSAQIFVKNFVTLKSERTKENIS